MWKVLAVLGPAAVLGVAGAWLGRPEPWVADAEVQAQIDLLARQQPGVVVVGNSLAATDVDALALSKALGLTATTLRENGSPGSTWYAVLKHRVFGAGHRPKLVLVVSTLRYMLSAVPENAEGMMRLQRHFSEPDAALQAKVFGDEGSPIWLRVLDRRTHAREAVLAGLKAAGESLSGPVTGEDGAEVSADAALTELFDAENLIGERANGVLPVAAREEVAKQAADAPLSPASSLIPDILALAAEHGARVVFVRVPVAPSAAREDEIPADTEAATIRMINEAGGGWLDMRSLGLTEGAFRDSRHMNAQGQKTLTAALTRRLQEIGALSDAPIQAAALPLRPERLERTGAPPGFDLAPRLHDPPCGHAAPLPALSFLADTALNTAGVEGRSPVVVLEDGAPLQPSAQKSDLGPDCHGAYSHYPNAIRLSPSPGKAAATYRAVLNPAFPLQQAGTAQWWLYPGTQITAAFAEAWDRGPFAVQAEGLRFGPATGSIRLSLVEDGQERASTTLSGAGDTLAATLQPPPPRGPWELQIQAAADAPYLLLRSLRLGEGRDPSTALLTSSPKVTPLHPFPLQCGPPPALPPSAVASSPRRSRDLTDLPAPGLSALSVDALADLTGTRRNSPVQLLEDGAPLPRGNGTLDEIKAGKPGVYIHMAQGILFLSSDGSDPLTNGRTYTARLDPERRTVHGRWLYPGDACTMALDPRKIRRPVRSLLLSGGTVGDVPPGEYATVRLLSGAEVLLDTRIDWTQAREGLEWSLPEGRRDPLTLELTASPGMPYIFLKLLSVAD